MPENRFEFRYKVRDVASAQRMRMLRSKQIKIMIGIWLVSSLFLLVPMLLPDLFPGSPFTSWQVVLSIALVYAVTLGVLLFITPYLDFAFNRFWRLPLLLRFNDKQLRLSVAGGKSKGLVLPWKQIQRFDENERVFILYYGEGNKFIVLPKVIFQEATKKARAEERFRDLLRRRASIAVIEEEVDEADRSDTVEEVDVDDKLKPDSGIGSSKEEANNE